MLEILESEPQAIVRLSGVRSPKPFELITEWAIMQWHCVGSTEVGLDQEWTTTLYALVPLVLRGIRYMTVCLYLCPDTRRTLLTAATICKGARKPH